MASSISTTTTSTGGSGGRVGGALAQQRQLRHDDDDDDAPSVGASMVSALTASIAGSDHHAAHAVHARNSNSRTSRSNDNDHDHIYRSAQEDDDFADAMVRAQQQQAQRGAGPDPPASSLSCTRDVPDMEGKLAPKADTATSTTTPTITRMLHVPHRRMLESCYWRRRKRRPA